MLMKYAQNKEVAWRMVDGEAVLVHPGLSEVKVLNEVGSRIWEICEDGSSLEEIVGVICDEFDAATEEARADAEAFLREMVEKGLVVQGDGTA
jgi:hypothetical protein